MSCGLSVAAVKCGECGRLMMSVVRTGHNSYIHCGFNAKFMNADTPS